MCLKRIIKNKYHLLRNKSLKIGANVSLSKSNFFGENVTIGDYCGIYNSDLGKGTYVSYSTVLSNVKMGKFCSIGPQVIIGPGNHPTNNFISTHPAFYSTENHSGFTFVSANTFFHETKVTNIGNDVWVGAKALIMDGVNIGNGAIVGAGAIVTKDVPAYAIVAGVPAKVIRYRFEQEEIRKLENLKWWDWSEEKLIKNIKLFGDVSQLKTLVRESGTE